MQQICVFHVHLDAPPGRPHMLPHRERSMGSCACDITCMLSFFNFNLRIQNEMSLERGGRGITYQVSNVGVHILFFILYSNRLETGSHSQLLSPSREWEERYVSTCF